MLFPVKKTILYYYIIHDTFEINQNIVQNINYIKSQN